MLIGVETDVSEYDGFDGNQQATSPWEIAEHIFLVIFVIEMGLKIAAFRIGFFKDGWDMFDLVGPC